MLEGEHWMSPPPSYPPILNDGIYLSYFSLISMAKYIYLLAMPISI